MTGGHGEHWKMAVAMWQEMSPNRPLFEGGEEEDELGASTGGGGGIVDITSDTASEATGSGGTDGTSGGLDFDLGDSTGGGSGSGEGDNEMLDLTASQDEADDDMLDLTSSTGSRNTPEDTRTLAQSEAPGENTSATAGGGQAAAHDNGLDFSLDDSGSDLLDVTSGGSAVASDDDDILDITASGSKAESADDNSLDFSLDDSDTAADEVEAGVPAADSGEHDNMLEFEGASATDDDDSLELDSGTSTTADDGLELDTGAKADEQPADKQPDSGGETAASGFDDLDLQIESYDDSADLDEIGEELDRLDPGRPIAPGNHAIRLWQYLRCARGHRQRAGEFLWRAERKHCR